MIEIFDTEEQAMELYNKILSNKTKSDDVQLLPILKKFVIIFTKGYKN